MSNLTSFFAKHARPFVLDCAWKFAVIVAVFAVTLWVAVAVEQSSEQPEPQLYTVHFDGIDYQDLEQIYSVRHSCAYRTRAGKRIEFYGSFYEVEQ